MKGKINHKLDQLSSILGCVELLPNDIGEGHEQIGLTVKLHM